MRGVGLCVDFLIRLVVVQKDLIRIEVVRYKKIVPPYHLCSQQWLTDAQFHFSTCLALGVAFVVLQSVSGRLLDRFLPSIYERFLSALPKKTHLQQE